MTYWGTPTMPAAAAPRPSTLTRPFTLLLALLVPLLVAALLLAAPPVSAQARPGWDVERLAGEDATILSAAVSNRTVVDADVVVLARGDDYPDALAGAPLASLLDAPILLTDRDELPRHVYTEIDRLRPSLVVLLGGPAALSPAIESELTDRLAIQQVHRIGGPTRYDTAAMIAREVVARGGDGARAFLVRGEHAEPTRAWPDAVAVSAYAARHGWPIVLAGDAAVPGTTTSALDAMGTRDVTVIGGPAAISHEVASQVAADGRSVSRLAGDSRFATSLAVADAALADGASLDEVWLVTGGQYADALVSSLAVAETNGVMLMVDGMHWDPSAARDLLYARAGDIDRVTVVGDPNVIPPDVDRELVLARTGPTSPPSTAGAVRVEVGQSIQAAVNAHPPGTHFVLASGVHRNQTVTPKDGMRFTGETGTVMNGAIPLPASAFTRLPDGRWVAAAPAEDPPELGHTVEMEPGYEREGYPNELWGDHRRLDHVNARDMVNRPGTWFYDYAADQVVMFDNPAWYRTVELSVTPRAFDAPYGSQIRDVVIENIVITRYANLPSRGAIEASASHHWTISQVELLENHATGLKVGPGMVVRDSRFIRNGQMGIGGTDVDHANGYTAPVTIVNNEVAHNGELHFEWSWEGGSIKFGTTDGLTMSNNWVHSHRGPGPWMDVDSRHSTIESNLVEFNMWNGIMYEISRDGVIRNNTIRHNGVLAFGDLGSGLWISNSQDVLVEHNLIEGNRLPINLQSSPVETGKDGERLVRNALVRDNDIRIDFLAPGLRVTSDDDHLYSEGNNRFESNTYRLRPESDRNFYWGGFYTVEGWQGELGHDTDGEFKDLTARGSAPPSPFQLQPVGVS